MTMHLTEQRNILAIDDNNLILEPFINAGYDVIGGKVRNTDKLEITVMDYPGDFFEMANFSEIIDFNFTGFSQLKVYLSETGVHITKSVTPDC